MRMIIMSWMATRRVAQPIWIANWIIALAWWLLFEGERSLLFIAFIRDSDERTVRQSQCSSEFSLNSEENARAKTKFNPSSSSSSLQHHQYETGTSHYWLFHSLHLHSLSCSHVASQSVMLPVAKEAFEMITTSELWASLLLSLGSGFFFIDH